MTHDECRIATLDELISNRKEAKDLKTKADKIAEQLIHGKTVVDLARNLSIENHSATDFQPPNKNL